MSWSGGTDIVFEIVPYIKKAISGIGARQQVYRALLASLEVQGWAEHEECRGLDPALDELLIIQEE